MLVRHMRAIARFSRAPAGHAFTVIFCIFLVAGVISMSRPIVLSAASPCECKDAHNILFRIKEARTAIAAYKAEIAKMEAREKSTGTPVMFSNEANTNQLRPQIQAALDALRASDPSPTASPATGTTGPTQCKVTVSGGTACLQEAIRQHEGVHATRCLKKWGVSLVKGQTDYRDGMRLAEFAQEEIEAYLVEIAFLESEYRKLPEQCKLPGWFVYFEVAVRAQFSQTQKTSGSTWKIDHNYSGQHELREQAPMFNPNAFNPNMSPQAIMQALQNQSAIRWYNLKQMTVPVHVSVQDEISGYGKEFGEGDSWELTKATQTSSGSGTGAVPGPAFMIQMDPKKNVYNVTILVQPAAQSSSSTVVITTKTDVEHTPYGFGPGPTKYTKPLEIRKVPFDGIVFPTVKGLLENGQIHHATDLPLKIANDVLEFDSGQVTPTSPFLGGLPEKNVTVRVYYRISKLPTN